MLKHSINIAGHATSISMEPEFWDALKHLATERHLSVNALVRDIDENRAEDNLSSAIRIYILKDLQDRLSLKA